MPGGDEDSAAGRPARRRTRGGSTFLLVRRHRARYHAWPAAASVRPGPASRTVDRAPV